MYADGIVAYLNAVFRSNLTGKQFQRGRYFGIAKKVVRQGENPSDKTTFQVLLDNDGVDVGDLINDKYSIALYHRCNSFAFRDVVTNQKDSFGDEASVKGITMNMVMVVYGDRKTLSTTNEELCTRFYLSFPSVLPPAAKQTLLGVQIATINPVSANNISQGAGSVSDQEGIVVGLEEILFSISYQINLTIDSGCTNCIPYCEWSSCVQEIRSCSPLVMGAQFDTFTTIAGVDEYYRPAIHNKTVQFVLGPKVRLESGVEYTWNPLTDTFKYIDPVNLPVAAGQLITIAYL